MPLLTDIDQIEVSARKLGLSIAELCEEAEIDRATWQRWKAGKVRPLLDSWQRVQSVIKRREAA